MKREGFGEVSPSSNPHGRGGEPAFSAVFRGKGDRRCSKKKVGPSPARSFHMGLNKPRRGEERRGCTLPHDQVWKTMTIYSSEEREKRAEFTAGTRRLRMETAEGRKKKKKSPYHIDGREPGEKFYQYVLGSRGERTEGRILDAFLRRKTSTTLA